MIDTGSQPSVVFGDTFCSETFRKKSVPQPSDRQKVQVHEVIGDHGVVTRMSEERPTGADLCHRSGWENKDQGQR